MKLPNFWRSFSTQLNVFHLYSILTSNNESSKLSKFHFNFWCTSNPQPIGFSGILLAKRQNLFYCTYSLHNRNVADTKSPYPIKRLEVIRRFNYKDIRTSESVGFHYIDNQTMCISIPRWLLWFELKEHQIAP